MAEGKPLKGCCLSMCPPAEMRLRQREKLVHIMECRRGFPGATAGAAQQQQAASRRKPSLQGDPQCFVKEFARCSAGKQIQAREVRPMPVLVRTLRYLLTDVYVRGGCPPATVHEFVCNRLRAVRQDLAVQGLLSSLRSAPLLAACTRYYTLQQYRMSEHSLVDFDPFLNMKALQETIAAIVRLYKDEQHLNANTADHTQIQQPQFTFDLDDDEDEFLIVDKGNDGASVSTPHGATSSSSANCSGDSSNSNGKSSSDSGFNSSSSFSTTTQSNDRDELNNAAVDCGIEDTTEEDIPNDISSSSSVVDSNKLQYCNGIEMNSSSNSRGVQFNCLQEQQEIRDVLTRIENLDLEAVGGVAQNNDNTRVHSNKDEKNRENQTLMDKDGNHSENSIPECCERWTNINTCSIDDHLQGDVTGDTQSSNADEKLKSSNSRASATIVSYGEREEMECLYLLLNYDNSEALEHVLQLPATLTSGPLLSSVLPAVISYHNSGNYVPLLKLFNVLPSILCCALILNLPKIQKRILQVLSAGHSSPNTRYPLTELCKLLVLPGVQEAEELCRHYGLTITGEQHEFVAFQKKHFKSDASVVAMRRVCWLDNRLESDCSATLLLPHTLALH